MLAVMVAVLFLVLAPLGGDPGVNADTASPLGVGCASAVNQYDIPDDIKRPFRQAPWWGGGGGGGTCRQQFNHVCIIDGIRIDSHCRWVANPGEPARCG